jgi:asparagine synthase (glutamine-hydrolysing)
VGNFFAVISPDDARSRSEELFNAGLRHARRIKSLDPKRKVGDDCARAASFARQNGSGGELVTDASTGCWLTVVGSWFHAEGYGAGDEPWLLTRILETTVAHVAQELEGFFVLVFCEARSGEVFVVTDLMGSRHCFMRAVGDCVALSTSSLLLAALGDVTPDPLGCEEFLRTGAIYEDRTLFREVKKLAPGTVCRFAGGKLADAVRYWRMCDLDPEAFDGEDAAQLLGERLIGVAEQITAVYRRPVCDLTGGYDSRSVVAAFLNAGVEFETTVLGGDFDPDVVISKGLSKLIGVTNRQFAPEEEISAEALRGALRLTDGECDLIQYARVQSLHRNLSSEYDVSVNGSYGEIARGYWWNLLFPKTGKRERLDSRRLAMRRYAADPSSPCLFPPGAGLDFVEHMAMIIGRLNLTLDGWPNTAQMDHAYLMLRMQRWQGRIASATDQIWPCLSPFMFRPVLETALQTTVRTRKQSRLVRSLMAMLSPQLAAYPLAQGYPAAPLTSKSLPRFAPLVLRYARKAWGKAKERWFDRSFDLTGPKPDRLRLLDDEEIRETLDPAKMKLSRLIDPARLREFLESSQQPRFAFDAQWRRVLATEMALDFACARQMAAGAGQLPD